ncbi:response regulator transcription factor [Agromyces seonyuensis]|uniref:Response regulator n=1 Tax=Agromyces seonyuensis TaxID=2662446 RepID=A0A6I4P060_9MICO|nr:response regulator transcription factor [Agromyces seonyuensis]MWB99930.1 response regulator [Agromyces seonyuensis]
MNRILVAEDEPRISSFLDRGLTAAGYDVRLVADGALALAEARTGLYDLLLLDLGLPEVDGFEVLSALRAEGVPIAVVILTARDSAEDTVAGLDGGANDYLAKPFRFDELLARVRLRLKEARVSEPDGSLAFAGLELDVRGRRIAVRGRVVDLSAREFALAEELLRHPDQVLSREQLLSRVWGFDFDPGSNVVDVYVRYLRNKIGANYIETVRGMGYRLVDPDHSVVVR